MPHVDQPSKAATDPMENAWEAASRSVVGGVDPEDFARGWNAARRVSPTEADREVRAINAAYSVMLDETNLPDDFDAARKMARAALKALRLEVSGE